MNVTSHTTIWLNKHISVTLRVTSLFDKSYWIAPHHKVDGFREPKKELTWQEKYWFWFRLRNEFQHTIQCRLGLGS